MNAFRSFISVLFTVSLTVAVSATMTTGCMMGDEGQKTSLAPGVDKDGDNHDSIDSGGDDCNDDDAAVHPGAVENCTNGKDDDCNGKIDAADPACSTTCTAGEKVACNDCKLNANYTDGTKTCQPNGSWGSCTGCANNDVDGDGHTTTAAGGDDCNDNNASIHPGATDICGDGIDQDCSNGDAVCPSGCNPGTTQSCSGCSSITQTCLSDRTWSVCTCPNNDVDGDGHTTTAAGGDDCNDNNASIHPGATDICGDGIDQDCSGSDATCTVSGPTACANVSGITEWEDVTLIVRTTETSTVRFMGMCGVYDSSLKKWTTSSDYTVIPGCENVSGSGGTFTCNTRRPKGWSNFEGNNYLNNGYWSVGVLTLSEAQAVCPSSYNSTTKTCNDLWSVMSKHGDYSINGTACQTSVNWVPNGNNDSFNCRI